MKKQIIFVLQLLFFIAFISAQTFDRDADIMQLWDIVIENMIYADYTMTTYKSSLKNDQTILYGQNLSNFRRIRSGIYEQAIQYGKILLFNNQDGIITFELQLNCESDNDAQIVANKIIDIISFYLESEVDLDDNIPMWEGPFISKGLKLLFREINLVIVTTGTKEDYSDNVVNIDFSSLKNISF